MRIKLLGPVEVEQNGIPVRIGGPQQRRILALLVIHRRHSVSSDRLIDALWADGEAPDGATRSMRTYLSRLRVVLPEGSIITSRSGYTLDPDRLTIDLDDFDALLRAAETTSPDVAAERYESALALWRGPPFGEFTDEWWATAESTRLIEQRLCAEEGLATSLASSGRHAVAIPLLQRTVAEQPLRERPVLLLTHSLRATGRRSEALRVVRAFRTRLAETTGLDPSSELVALESSVLADDDVTSQARPVRGYIVHDIIGEGAHGRVYEATQPGTDRRVAIKMIRPDRANSTDFVRRFEAEARLVARLEHPHIVPLYDYWREPGGAYLVFRLLTGGSARDAVVSGGPWSLHRVSGLVEEIGGALISAHAAGVAHNDVKAANVLLDATGAAFLTDFGIAVSGDDPRMAEAAQSVDLADLAWLVWELLTGSTTPTGRSSFTSRNRNSAPPSLVSRMVDPPAGIDALLAHAATVDSQVRSVAEFVLGWRAATGYREGVHPALTSSDRRAADSSRRRAARRLTLATSAGINPYRGLRPFDEADSDAFHGRDDVIDDLVTTLESTSLVTVIGASGSGKSSVVRAGLIPRGRDDGAVVASMVPGDDPLRALTVAWSEIATSDVTPVDAPALIIALTDVARRFGRLLIVVDQLEECWTRASEERRGSFLDVLAAAIDNPEADIRVVTTVRADILDRLLEHPRLGPMVGRGAIVLPPLSPAGLAAAVVTPAERVDVWFEDGVAAELIAEAARNPGSLPMLQFALTELYDRRVDGVIGQPALQALGGLAGAIGRRAEEVFGQLDGEQQANARDLFARLVAPGRGLPDTRRRARLADLSAEMRSVADHFVGTRLLVIDSDPATREATLELAHEALITRWDRLDEWVADDRRWLEQVQHLSAAARGWDDGGRSDGELYRGARLEAAIEAIDGEGRAVSPLEQEFVDGGRVARDEELITAQRTSRRLRRRLVAVGVMLVVALVAGTVAFVQRRDATESARQALAAERAALIESLVGRIGALRGTQRDTAALLAVEAFRLSDTPRTRSALLATFTDDERFFDAHHFAGDRGTSGIVMPDGASAYLTAQDGTVHPYDLDEGTLGPPLPTVGEGDQLPVLAASADGDRLVIAARSDPAAGPSTVGVVDTASGTLVYPPTSVDGSVVSAAFLPGDRLALAIGEAGDVVVADATNGSEEARIDGVDIEPDEVIWTLDPGVGGRGRVLRRPTVVGVADDQLMVGSADGSLRVFDASTLTQLQVLERPAETVSTLRPLADGTIVTSGRFGFARFDATTGDAIWESSEFSRCMNVALDEAAGLVYCGDPYGRLEARDLSTGAVVRRLDAQNGSSGSLWLAHRAAELVSFGRDEPVVSRWRLDGSGPITDVVAPGWTPTEFDIAGNMILVERGDLESDTYRIGFVDRSTGAVTELDGPAFASWTTSGSMFGFWRDETGAPVFSERALAGGVPDGDMEVTDVVLERPDDIADAVIGSGKERMLIRYDKRPGDSLATFDPDTLTYGATIEVDGLVSWAVNRTGDRVVAGTSSGVIVYDGNTRNVLGTLGDPDLRAVVVTATDQLFVGSLGGELTQHDLSTLEPLRTLGGGRGLLFGGAGTADGSLLATTSGDRVAALYDVASGTQLGGPIEIAADEHNAVHLSPDGRWLIVGGQPAAYEDVVGFDAAEQHGMQIWDLDPGAWIRAACAVAGRDLTREEWTAHIGDLAPFHSTCSEL